MRCQATIAIEKSSASPASTRRIVTLVVDLELRQERSTRQRELRERRRQALERPEAAAELALAEAEVDAYFAVVNEIGRQALDQELADDDDDEPA